MIVMKAKKLLFLLVVCFGVIHKPIMAMVSLSGVEIPLEANDALQLIRLWSADPDKHVGTIAQLLAKIPLNLRPQVTDALIRESGKTLSNAMGHVANSIIRSLTQEVVSVPLVPEVSQQAATGWFSGIRSTASDWASSAGDWWRDMSLDQISQNIPTHKEFAQLVKDNPKIAIAAALGTAALWGGVIYKLRSHYRTKAAPTEKKPALVREEAMSKEAQTVTGIPEVPLAQQEVVLPEPEITFREEFAQLGDFEPRDINILKSVGLTLSDIVSFSTTLLNGDWKVGEKALEKSSDKKSVLKKNGFSMVVTYDYDVNKGVIIKTIKVKATKDARERTYDVYENNKFSRTEIKRLTAFLIRRIEKAAGLREQSKVL